jgi:simple sugar transport system ATP-binding protein
MAIADRVTILRDGRVVDTTPVSDTSPEKLARAMVGREVILRVEKPEAQVGDEVLSVEDYSVPGRSGPGPREISFAVHAGEILGIAGVEGNGQFELEEGLFGLRAASAGRVKIHGREVEPTTAARRASGIAYVPSDRLKRGLVPPFTVAWNAILGSQRRAPFSRRGVLQDGAIAEHADRLIRDYQVRAPGREAVVAGLSGGNQQKLVVARELARDPAVVLACQPTRGLDVGAIEYIHNRLLDMRQHGKAVLLISAELDEIRALADRILVMYEGRIVAERPAGADEHELGLLMAGHEVA